MKEKLIQIYEEMADITLQYLKHVKETKTIMSEDDIQMVSATLQFYNAIADDRQPKELFPQ